MPKGSALSRVTICRGKFLIGTKNNGLFVCQPQKHISPCQIKGVGNVITTLQTTSKGDVTVSSDGSGAFLIDGKTLQVKEVYNMKGDRKHRLPSDAPGVRCRRQQVWQQLRYVRPVGVGHVNALQIIGNISRSTSPRCDV